MKMRGPTTRFGLTMRRSPLFGYFLLAYLSRTHFGCDGNTAPALHEIVCILPARPLCHWLNLLTFLRPVCPRPFPPEPASLATQPFLPASCARVEFLRPAVPPTPTASVFFTPIRCLPFHLLDLWRGHDGGILWDPPPPPRPHSP